MLRTVWGEWKRTARRRACRSTFSAIREGVTDSYTENVSIIYTQRNMYHHFIHGFDDMDLPFQILKLMNVFEDDRRHVNELEDQISALEDERASAASEEVQTLNRTMFDLNAECKSKVAMLGEQLSDAQAQLDLNQGIRHSEFFYRASSLFS